MSEKIGFIGLGIMGRGMVDNLMKAGFEVTVWNRTASRMDPFVERRAASAADSPARGSGSQRYHHHLRQRYARCRSGRPGRGRRDSRRIGRRPGDRYEHD